MKRTLIIALLALATGCSHVRTLFTGARPTDAAHGVSGSSAPEPPPLLALIEGHLTKAGTMASAGSDSVGAVCWSKSLNLYRYAAQEFADGLDGLAPAIEAGRLVKRALAGGAIEDWVIACAPVYVEAKLTVTEFALRLFGRTLTGKLGLVRLVP